MLALKLLLMVAGALLWAVAVAIPVFALWLRFEIMRKKTGEDGTVDVNVVQPKAIPWRRSIAFAIAGCVPMLMAASIVVVPSGMGGVRISQLSGTLPGTLYPGVHIVTPLIDSVEIFDLRDHVFVAGTTGQGAKTAPTDTGLNVQSLEGLNIGLACHGALPARSQ